MLYGEDYVGNSVTKTGWFDMQDYPPKPTNISKNIIMENGQTVAEALGANWDILTDSQYGSYT